MHLTGKEVVVWWWACDLRTHSSSCICNNPEAAGLMKYRTEPPDCRGSRGSFLETILQGWSIILQNVVYPPNQHPIHDAVSPNGRTMVWKKQGSYLSSLPMTHLDNLFYLPMPIWRACFQWAETFIRQHSGSFIGL